MPLKVPSYVVLLAPPADTPDADPSEHVVDVIYGDQLRAELEGPRHGLTRVSDAPQHHVALWVWAALHRTHVLEQPWPEFKARLLALEAVKDAAGDQVAVEVDPTTGLGA